VNSPLSPETLKSVTIKLYSCFPILSPCFRFPFSGSYPKFCAYCSLLFFFLIIVLLLYWVYIVTFTKVVIVFHSWIYPLHHSPLSPLPLTFYSSKLSSFYIFLNNMLLDFISALYKNASFSVCFLGYTYILNDSKIFPYCI
jgi:hypothetical protein